MSDFHQATFIATLHRLGAPKFDHLEEKLAELREYRPIALVLPSLFSELKGAALPKIVQELKSIHYLNEIVIGLDRASEAEFKEARKFFSKLPQEHHIIWNDGPRVQGIHQLITDAELNIGPQGKGRSAWLSYGYVLATGRSSVIALHDCDILTYSRELLARLVYPVANPDFDYEFCKGYYARYSDRMHGRVTRLFVSPLIRSLQRLAGSIPFLNYLDSFRYPLAGEFSMATDLARINRIPADWGLEVGTLAEVYRNCALKRICQVDLAESYDHKHQPLSARDHTKGLTRMAADIARSIFRNLASEGVILSEGFFRTLQPVYIRFAQDTIKRYEDDAAINNLKFDRHSEGRAVETFTRALRLAGEDFLKDPLGAPQIPNWNRVHSAIPEIYDLLNEAVEADNS